MKRGIQQPTTSLFLAFSIFVGSILTDSFILAQVNVEPNIAVLNEGDPTELLCRYGRTINYCRIEIPGEKVLNLSPEWSSKIQGFSYFGAGLAAGQCGVSIERVKANNNGYVNCSLGVEGEEVSGIIELVVARRPLQPIIEPISRPNRDDYYTEGTQFTARCSVRNGRPAANITWLMDGYPANKPTDQLQVIDSPTQDNVMLFTAEQQIQWNLGSDDNGRRLVCRSHHQTDRENVPPQEGAFQLRVLYAPVRQPEQTVYGLYLEHTAIVNITIRANPSPVVEWTVDGVVIPQGTQEGRFSVYEPVNLGHDFYNVTLVIAGLSLEDTTKKYQARASNELGSTDYQVRISSSSTPPIAGLDAGAIVGIAVAVAVLVLIILLVVFARATRRWCFAAKPLKASTNETGKDTNQNGQSIALLDEPNGVTVVNHKQYDTESQKSSQNTNDRLSVQRRSHPVDEEDDSFEYATDRESSVYNPTTMPLRSVMALAGGRNSQKAQKGENTVENADLLSRGSQLGIPESRFSLWIPKDQRDIVEKQAKLLANRVTPKTPEPQRAVETTKKPQAIETEI